MNTQGSFFPENRTPPMVGDWMVGYCHLTDAELEVRDFLGDANATREVVLRIERGDFDLQVLQNDSQASASARERIAEIKAAVDSLTRRICTLRKLILEARARVKFEDLDLHLYYMWLADSTPANRAELLELLCAAKLEAEEEIDSLNDDLQVEEDLLPEGLLQAFRERQKWLAIATGPRREYPLNVTITPSVAGRD